MPTPDTIGHAGPSVEVTVSYTLHEYKRVLRDVISLQYPQAGRRTKNRLLPWNWPITETALFGVFVPMVFRWKMSRVGDCVFTFNEAGLSRTSKGRTAFRAWDQVERVQTLSTAYLIELKEGGAMPVPFRAFTADQRALFAVLIERAG